MTFEDMDLSELPPKLCRVVEAKLYEWENFKPDRSAQDDAPFGTNWCKYVYWIPRIKKELYTLVISQPPAKLHEKLFVELGMDEKWFKKNYVDFIRRLDWMRENFTYSHLGEL